MPTGAAYNAYINWVLYAVVGNMGGADNLMRQSGSGIRSVARHLQKTRKPRLKTVYRGLLLDPEESESGIIHQDPRLTFVSFSEDRDVACWFADPTSVMSSFVKEHRPRVEGWLMELKPKLSDVLFHHSWNPIVIPGGRGVRLEAAAAMHPEIIFDQFEWNLKTQNEVILKPLRAGQPVEAYELSDCPDDLDERFVVPSLRKQFGL
jgi:hypothetical protein